MAILGTLLKKGIDLGKVVELEELSPFEQQKRELRKLLRKAKLTQFGLQYNFGTILKTLDRFSLRKHDPGLFYKLYANHVPVYNYNKIHKDWWYKTLEGQANVCWPGKVKFFALSSGTSEAATKHIPITNSMLKAIRKTSIKQILALKNFDLPANYFSKGILMLGGSTKLNYTGHSYEGDLSGITTGKLPFWFHYFYKPGRKVAQTKDWTIKLDKITADAPNWDIGTIAGVPAWIQLMMERIIAEYKLNNIHEIWPNLEVFTHGGVSFEPYKKSFEKLLGRPIQYIETYLASEGFIAFQTKPGNVMKMVLNNGIFYEFVPFTEDNFDADGELKNHPQTLMIHEVEENKEYALLLSTCAGTWRYLIGDVIKFMNTKECEIIISGRTKHYLSLCGEHLSVDNMNKAIQMVSEELNIDIREFSVAGIPYQSMFAHKWYIGTENKVDKALLKERLDTHLKALNDDYRTERIEALQEIMIELLPPHYFYEWMKLQGKEGGQNKFPRVLKKSKYEDWEVFLKGKE